jgi:nucleoid DNA-binding protein
VATTKKALTGRIAASAGEQQSLVRTVIYHFFDEIIAELAKGNRSNSGTSAFSRRK